MPKAFPLKCRRDEVAVARQSDAPIAQVARDFGISESCLLHWLKFDDVEEGRRPGATRAETAELREAKKLDPPAGAGERGTAAGGGVSGTGVNPK